MKRYQRWLVVIFTVVVILPILLIVAALLALRSETGTQWVLDQVPGLAVDSGHGSLLGSWRAKSVHWQGYGVGLVVVSPVVEWSPRCLTEKKLCLDVLHAEQVDLTVQPGGETEKPDREAIKLPALRSPLGIVVDDVRLGPFTVNGIPVWNLVTASAQGSGSDWELTSAYYQRDDIIVEASGRVSTRGDWPATVDASVKLPSPSEAEWQVDVGARGSVADLRISGTSSGYLNAGFEGRVAPLEPELPLKLEFDAERFHAHDSLPDTLTLMGWSGLLEGDLDKGINVSTRARLPGTQGEIDASVRGVVTTSSARDLVVELTGPKVQNTTDDSSTQGEVEVTGNVSWDSQLQANADLQLTDFPWYSLIPGMEPPPVVLESLNAHATYDDGRYKGDLTMASTGPMGEANVSARVDGDLASVNIAELSAQTGAGSLKGEGVVGFDGSLTWQAMLQLEEFNPGYWVPLLQASLNGDIKTRGSVPEKGDPELTADWHLAGTWGGSDTLVDGALTAKQGLWELTDLALNVGQNELTGHGELGEELAADIVLSFPDLSELLPELHGQLNGTVSASGTVEQPNGKLRLEGSSLAWADVFKVDTVNLNAALRDHLTIDSTLVAGNIEVAGQTVDSLELALTGNPDEHQLTIAGAGEELKTHVRFNGRWQEGWDGQLSEGTLNLLEQGQVWRLAQPADIRYQIAGNHLSVAAHCWRWQDSTVCAEDQTLLPDPDIHYRLERFPTLALAPLLPDTVRWQAQIDAELRVRIIDGQPDGVIELGVSPGSIDVLVEGDWIALKYNLLHLSAKLKPDAAELSFNLDGPDLGELTINLEVDPIAEARPVKGSFKLAGLDLGMLAGLAELEEVAGELNGEGTIKGPLLAPEIYGDITLSKGKLIDPRVPVPLEDIEFGLTLNGTEGDLSGQWRSNKQGTGELSGHIDWAGEPSLELALRGNRIPLHYEPYAQVELSPDLSIAYSAGGLAVSGSIAVPRGAIEVRGLPEQAVSVSADEEIVGVEKEQPVLRSLNMNVVVVVGEDKVSFDGFGIEGNLEGRIRIGNDMDTRGVLQLVDGKYEAYGQELTLRRARLVFVGPVAEPYLDIEAIREVKEVVAGIRLTGPALSPQIEVFSEPDMSQDNALSYIILGRPLQDSGDQGDMRQAALSLGLTQASKITQGIGEEFGIRELTLEAEGAGDDASVVASGYITDDLSLRYGVGIFNPTTTVALRYDLGRYFYLEAASGLAASLDIFYTRDF